MAPSFLTNEERQARKRTFRTIGLGFIGILLLSGLAIVGVYLLKNQQQQDAILKSRAENEARELAGKLLTAAKENDKETVEQLYQKIIELQPAADDLRHLILVTAIDLEDKETADRLRAELAPAEGPTGHPMSHYLVGLEISKQKGLKQKEIELMTRHFKAAARSEDVPKEVYRLLGDCEYFNKNYAMALAHYRKMENPKPETQYKIGLSLMRMENPEAAIKEMELAASRFQEVVEDEPENTKAFVLWTKALSFSRRIDQAEDLLMDRLKKEDSMLVRNELIQSYLTQLRFTGNMTRRKEMLSRICNLDPDMKINRYTRQAFFQLANYLVNEDRYEEAKAYYEVSADRIPFPASVKNNLAWVETQLKDGDLQRALQLSNEAIGDGKNIPAEFVGTRGQILARLGQWEAAEKDLEWALDKVSQKKHVQLALVAVYARTDEMEKAETLYHLLGKEFGPLEKFLSRYPTGNPELNDDESQ